MTKGHTNFGASGLHGVREKQINEKIEWPWMIEFLHPYQDGRCEYGVSFQYTNMFFLSENCYFQRIFKNFEVSGE